MPEYLAPGVFVEEVSFRQATIEGVSTSVAAIVGPTRTGPIRGRPLLLTSYSDYTNTFGDAEDLVYGTTTVTNYTAYAANAFFGNGGQQLYLARITNDVLGEGDPTQRAKTASLTVPSGGTALIDLIARFPGAAGNVAVVFKPRRSQKLLQLSAPAPTDTVLLKLDTVQQADLIGLANPPPAGSFPLQSLTAVAQHEAADATNPERYQFVAGEPVIYVDQAGVTRTAQVAGFATAIKATAVPANRPQTVTVRPPAGLGASPLYAIPVGPTMRLVFGVPATTTTLYGTVGSGNVTLTKALNPSLAADVTGPLALLAMGRRTGDGDLYHDTYDIGIESHGLPIYSFPDVALEQDATNNLAVALAQTPSTGSAMTSEPIYAIYNGTVATPALWGDLLAAFDTAALNPTDPAVAPRYVLHLTGGTDGGVSPLTVDYAGAVDEVHGSFGLAALEDVDEVSIVLCPAAAADASIHQAVIVEMQKHCNKMLYRVGVVESPRGAAIADVQAFRAQFSDTRLALYYPWVMATSLNADGGQVLLPPSGFIAGIYADVDIRRGVHKAPANEVMQGALGLEVFVNTAQQEVLNPLGINCTRFFPNRGYRVWGGRTLSADPQWKYVNIRRYFLYLEHSISNATNWVVFEPNGQALWANIRATISDFLYNEWANGRLLGDRPELAYFVRCDLTTMTQNDLDNGRLVCLIGVAPLAPAEFVIFRIGQKTASA